jgi:hypothetical protein
MNKQEKFAWARLGIIILVMAYLIWHLLGDNELPVQKQRDVRGYISNSLYALVFLSLYLSHYVKGVDVDERDRAISGMAAKHGLVALSLMLLISTVVLQDHNYDGWISVRSPFWIEQYLILCIAFGWWIEASVSVFHYWRDRYGG